MGRGNGSTNMKTNAVLAGAAVAAVLALANPAHAGMLGGGFGGGLGGGVGGALGGGMGNLAGSMNGSAGGSMDSHFANPRFGRLNDGLKDGAQDTGRHTRQTAGAAKSDGSKGADATSNVIRSSAASAQGTVGGAAEASTWQAQSAATNATAEGTMATADATRSANAKPAATYPSPTHVWNASGSADGALGGSGHVAPASRADSGSTAERPASGSAQPHHSPAEYGASAALAGTATGRSANATAEGTSTGDGSVSASASR